MAFAGYLAQLWTEGKHSHTCGFGRPSDAGEVLVWNRVELATLSQEYEGFITACFLLPMRLGNSSISCSDVAMGCPYSVRKQPLYADARISYYSPLASC